MNRAKSDGSHNRLLSALSSTTRQRLLSESGGGIVVLQGEDVGIWKRVLSASEVLVTVWPDVLLDHAELEAVGAAAQALAAFLELPLHLAVADPQS